MYKNKYPNLFSPIVLGNRIFRNRIFASPTGYANNTGSGYFNEGAVAYYERKAQGGAASVASCEIIVDGEYGKHSPKHICADTPFINVNFARVAHAINFHGAVSSIELTHSGIFGNRNIATNTRAVEGKAYGPVDSAIGDKQVYAMDEAIIERTIKKFADAAGVAKRSGFQMITLHAGHGWLLHQFLSPSMNTRNDKWGGSAVENRARLTIEVCKAMRKTVGPGFPIEVRISGIEGVHEGAYGIDEGIAIAKQLDGHCDLIHVSAGNHEVDEAFVITHPGMFMPDGMLVEYAAEIKKHVKTPVATIGALSDPELMEEIIASGKADVVQAARQLIADPDFPKKIRSGREREARKCLRCMACFSNGFITGEHYCSINPESGHEWELRSEFPMELPEARRKKVLVIGGGCGGMQAALSCVKKGHKVILCEKEAQLGGVLRCEQEVAFKQNLDHYLDQQADLIEQEEHIDLRLNVTVTPEYAQSLEPDVIIASLGAVPIIPPIPGIDNNNVVSAIDAYDQYEEFGSNVIIIGAGLVGIELGLHLLSKGKNITIIEVTDKINDGGNPIHGKHLNYEIKKRGLKIEFSTRVANIMEDRVICNTDAGEVSFPADTVVYAVGQKPRMVEASAFYSCAPEVHLIGDCIAPRNMASATGEAFMIARNIGRR